MRPALLALLLLLLAPLAGIARADEPPPAQRVFLEVRASPSPAFVQQPVTLRLRVGYDSAFFDEHAAPLFRQAMDVPVHVRAPWIRTLPAGAEATPPPGQDAARLRFALNDDVVAGRVVGETLRDGRTYTVFEVVWRYLPSEPGPLRLEAPTLRFVTATRFDEDFVGGRTAVDPTDVVVEGPATALQVLPLPVAGRPEIFAGAVGRYTVRSRTDRRVVDLGEVLRLTLVIEGEGNLDLLDTPRLDDLAGFHVYGRLDDRGSPLRTIVYEVAPVAAEVTQVPAIPLAFFDPGPPHGYHVVRTEPIALEVRAVGELPGTSPAPEEEARTDAWTWWALLLVVLAGACVTIYVLRGGLDSAPGDAEGGDQARIRAARSALRARRGQPGAGVAALFAEYLAARLDVGPAAVVTPKLRARLEAAGVPGAVAARAARTLEALVAARYGSGGGDGAVAEGLVDDLEAAFEAHGATR